MINRDCLSVVASLLHSHTVKKLEEVTRSNLSSNHVNGYNDNSVPDW